MLLATESNLLPASVQNRSMTAGRSSVSQEGQVTAT